MRMERIYLVSLLAISSLLFFLNIWGYDLWPADEPRFAEVAREMMQTGNYLSPQVNGTPYKEKPPLLFWSIALVSLPVGDVTEFTARAPSALAGVLAVLLTYLLAARLYGSVVGFWSAIILATSDLFWWEARSVRTDMMLTALMTAGLYFFWRWHESRRTPWLIAFYGAMAAGLLTKGPPALVFPLLLVLSIYWKRPDDRRATHWMIGTLVSIAIVLAWFIPARMALGQAVSVQSGVENEFWRMTLGRIMGESKFQWPWYYLWNVPAGLLPWALFLPFVIPYVWRRRREDDRMRLLLSWTVPSFLFFSAVFGKRGVYLLPIFPALAILMSRGVLDLAQGEHAVWRKRTAYVWAGILFLLAAIPLGVALTQYPEMITQGTIIFGLCTFGFAFATVAGALRGEVRNIHAVVAIQTIVLALLVAVAVFPPLNEFKGASDICRPLRRLSEKGVSYRLYTLGFTREEFIYYSKHFHTPVLSDLLPISVPGKEKLAVDPAAMERKQRMMRKAIVKAAATVPVQNLEKPTQEELAALREVVQQAPGWVDSDPELVEAFDKSLSSAVRQFGAEFEQEEPAFLFVQQEDWKWLIALFPEFAKQRFLAHESVGRRDLLLLANRTGAEVAQKEGR